MAGEQEKQAQEVAVNKMRAFEVGIAHFCKDAGVPYAALAEAVEETPETLGPKLVEALVEAGENQQE